MLIESSNVIAQGMILATILAGFALAAAAQYAGSIDGAAVRSAQRATRLPAPGRTSRDSRASADDAMPQTVQRPAVIAVAYFFAGYTGLVCVWLGIAYALLPDGSPQQGAIGGFFMFALAGTTLMSIIAFAVNLAVKAERLDYGLMILALTIATVIVGVILIVLGLRTIPPAA